MHIHIHINAALLLPSCLECVGVIRENHSLNGADKKLYIHSTVLLSVVISCVVALNLTVLYTEIYKSYD